MNQTYVKTSAIKSTAQARNIRALEIFTRNGFSVRLLGTENSPMFILDGKYLLSCFVNGNNLYFRPSPDSGEISRTINLSENAYITKSEIVDLIDRSEHLEVFRVFHAGSRLFLVGFNRFHLEEDEIDGRFPVFATHNPVIYVNKNKAENIVQELNVQGYNVNVI